MARHTSLVFSRAIGILHDEAEAAGVTQQTFVRAYENLASWRGENLAPWLATIASYTALKNRLVRLLLQNGFTVTGRMYNGYETDTGYHHYTVDAAQYYETEE